MDENSKLHVVIGTGPLGMAVMRELAARGRQVRVVNRSGTAEVPAGVQVVAGDVSDPTSAREVCAAAQSIYLCAKPPDTEWPEMFPPIMDGAIDAAVVTGAKLIYADNLYAYGPFSGPLREDMPYGAQGRKGKTRAQMAAKLIAVHEDGKVRATIGRVSDFYGPGVIESAVGERVFGFALAGKAASVLGNPNVQHTYTFIGDFARGLVTLSERDEALGQVWLIPSADTVTTQEFVNMVFEEIGAPSKLQIAPRWLVSLLGILNPTMRELKEVLYQSEQPFVVDHSKYKHAFGADTTPHPQAIRETLDWYRRIAG